MAIASRSLGAPIEAKGKQAAIAPASDEIATIRFDDTMMSSSLIEPPDDNADHGAEQSEKNEQVHRDCSAMTQHACRAARTRCYAGTATSSSGFHSTK
jgi:hypothetical protein